MTRVALIGLDGVPPGPLAGPWRTELPVLGGLVGAGAYGTLWSCLPPITVPAWSCMLSSNDPGQLGVYGFRNRADHGYGPLRMATSRDIKAPRVWDLVGAAGGRSIVIGVPGTYPPPAIEGIVVADFLSPGLDSAFTYPAAVRARVRECAPDYRFDVSDFRRTDIDGLVADVAAMTRDRFRLARRFAATEPWDFFAVHEIGTDRLHHRLWPASFDGPGGTAAPDDDAAAGLLLGYYRLLDHEIGLLLDALPADTVVMVASDHGARHMRGGVRVNQWLADHGYLRLLRDTPPPGSVTPETIDWEHTMVWGEGGYYARICLNVQGREPRGTVPADQVGSLLEELRQGLADIRDDAGRPMTTTVRTPGELYRDQRGVPPDLLVLFGDLACRSIGTLGGGEVFTRDNDIGIDIANHSMDGMVMISGAAARLGTGADAPALYDVAPTILDLLGLPVPEHMIGRSMIDRRSA